MEGVSDAFLCSAVRTLDKAATAAALCELSPERAGFRDVALAEEVGLKAEFNAAIAEAL